MDWGPCQLNRIKLPEDPGHDRDKIDKSCSQLIPNYTSDPNSPPKQRAAHIFFNFPEVQYTNVETLIDNSLLYEEVRPPQYTVRAPLR